MTEFDYWKARMDLESRRVFYANLKKDLIDQDADRDLVDTIMKIEHQYHFELLQLDFDYRWVDDE